MINPTKNIGLLLIAIILIPILFFIAREIYSLSDNEAVIEKIYRNQVESLLFSINQYSEDLVRSWGMKLETVSTENRNDNSQLISRAKELMKANPALQNIFVADSNFRISNMNFKEGFPDDKNIEAGLARVLLKNNALIVRLTQYKKLNFTKFEPLDDSSIPNVQILVYMLNDKQVCGFIFDKNKFVKDNLSLKIQSIARNEFAVSVYDSSTSKRIYSTNGLGKSEFVQSRKLWLIPSYSLGITLRGESLNDIIRGRTYSGILLISILAIMMLLVAWFGYKNIKKEVELAQIKNEFVSNVSHELRTPLALINMFAETLYMGRVKNEEKRNEYYGIIQQETERLSKIVNKILNFSKIEAGKWKYVFQRVDLNSLSEKIFSNYKFHLENKGFKFSFEPTIETLEAELDSEAVSEAIINVIDNAVKYSEERKEIIVKTGWDGDNIYVEVKDSGFGISEEDQKRIFEKFYRVQTGNIHNTKGTGLGLTLVKHIMDAHKGKIKLQSSLNKGTSFRLLFPINKIS